MTTKKKLHYLWDYYKLQIIGGVVAVVLVIYFIVLFTRPNDHILLNVAFVNQYENVTEDSPLMDDFLSSEGNSLTSEDLSFDAAYFFDLTNDGDYTNSYFQKLIAKAENGEVDVMVMGENNLLGIAQGGRTLDLRDEKAGDLLEEYPDRIIYYSDEETGEEIPVGIDVSDSQKLYGYTEDDQVTVSLSSKTANAENAVTFIEYLLQ